MNYTHETSKEISDRLQAIGLLGDRITEGRIDAALALETAQELILRATDHLHSTTN